MLVTVPVCRYPDELVYGRVFGNYIIFHLSFLDDYLELCYTEENGKRLFFEGGAEV